MKITGLKDSFGNEYMVELLIEDRVSSSDYPYRIKCSLYTVSRNTKWYSRKETISYTSKKILNSRLVYHKNLELLEEENIKNWGFDLFNEYVKENKFRNHIYKINNLEIKDPKAVIDSYINKL